MGSELSKKLMAIAKRRRAVSESPDVERFPSGQPIPQALEDPEPQPLRRRGQSVWKYPAQLVAKVPLSFKAFWMEAAREYKIEGGQSGLLFVVIEFLKDHPIVLAIIVLWHKRRERELRKVQGCERKKAA